VHDCVDRLQGRPAGGGKNLESSIDKWKCLHCVRIQNIYVTGGCSDRKKLKTVGMAHYKG